jgi:hypothetical protein
VDDYELGRLGMLILHAKFFLTFCFIYHSFEYVLRNFNMPAHPLTALCVGGGLDSHNVWVTNLHPGAHFGCRRCRFAIMK